MGSMWQTSEKGADLAAWDVLVRNGNPSRAAVNSIFRPTDITIHCDRRERIVRSADGGRRPGRESGLHRTDMLRG